MSELKFYALPNWNEINQCEVWDFCYLGEKPNSPFQFQINLSRAELNEHIIKEYDLFPKTSFNTLDKQIMGSVYGRLFSNHSIINTNIGFLEHQYKTTKDKNIFLNVLEQITNITNYTAFGADAMVNTPDIVRAVKSWRERKLERLSYIEDLIPSSLETSKKTENLCLTKGQIVDLYDLFVSENVIAPMDFPDFIKCFDLNNPPIKQPTTLYKKMFVFALTLIKGMNSDIALKYFGATNYNKTKNDLIKSPIPKNRRVTQNKISSILIQPVKVISK